MRPSPAFAVSILALACSLGGTAWAAATITGAQIKDGTVASIDVKNGSLTGTDIKNGSLTSTKLSAATRAALKGATGAKGDTGPQGIQGPAGGLSNVVTRRDTQSGPDDGPISASATCLAGETLVGGGIQSSDAQLASAASSYPAIDAIGTASPPGAKPTYWRAIAYNDTGGTASVTAFALCAS